MKGIVKTAIFAAFVIWALFVIFGNANAANGQQSNAKPFDHSQCQYPDRTTNPPNGCDNSDPADPYCAAKGLPEDCRAVTAPATQTTTSQNVPDTELPQFKEEVTGK